MQLSTSVSLLGAAVALVVIFLLLLLLTPALLAARESSRRNRCGQNLAAISQAIHQHVTAQDALPPIARGTELGMWIPGDRSDIMTRPSNVGWLLILLPYLTELDENHESSTIAPDKSIPELCCPSDEHNRRDNRFNEIFARGNYAINAGPNHSCIRPGDPGIPCFNGAWRTTGANGETIWYGDGVAGYNKTFRLHDFVNGLSRMVAIEEVRAGIDVADSRGVWQLAMVGSSVTHQHGFYGDDGSPNETWHRADDIYGCDETTMHVGEARLVAEKMPCCRYCVEARQATARSMHPGGVHCLMLDGAWRFIADNVSRNIWHVMHSRQYRLDYSLP